MVLHDRALLILVLLNLLPQVGSALEWIHSKGLCHLDVKLDNILVFK